MMDKETEKLASKLEHAVLGDRTGEDQILQLPDTARDAEDIIAEMTKLAAKDEAKWRSGKVSGTVYYGSAQLHTVMMKAIELFSLSNPLHPDVFGSVRRFEAEVVAWSLKLFHGGPASCGGMTSGGTESILMACRAYKEYAKATRGVLDPEMVVPTTAHAAFDKACEYFGIKLVHVPVDPVTFRAQPGAMAKAITKNTVMLVASAPCFPQGVIDPVSDIAAIAREAGVPLHVDCCLGSFLIPLAAEAGYAMPEFDFSVPGVTSISADTHKFGFAMKGSSVVMYADPKYRRHQYFVAPDWSGGIYASPAISGSRAGALIAATWACMQALGKQGYVQAARTQLGSARAVAAGIRELAAQGEGVVLAGEPDLTVVAFMTTPESGLNVFNVNDAMSARGWNLNALQNPACVHICITMANAATAKERFVADLKDAIHEVRTAPPGKYKDSMGAMYGMAASLPDKAPVDALARVYLDTLLKA